MRFGHLWLLFVFLFLISCGGFFERPKLSRQEYIQVFFPELEGKSGYKLDYLFKSSVGGYGTFALVQGDPELNKQIIKLKAVDIEPYQEDSNISELLQLNINGYFSKKKPNWLQFDRDGQYQLFEKQDGDTYTSIFASSDFKKLYFIRSGKSLKK